MPVYRIPRQHIFPAPDQAEPSGLLGIEGDLHPDRLLLAYSMGIFPWYSEGQPILWFSPDPRMVFDPAGIHVSRSLRKRMRRAEYRVSMDSAFAQVILACAEVHRPGQPGTWITADMQRAYCELHQLGYAHSVEVWRDRELIGGLYGVSLGGMFAGESMFSRADDASKVALVRLAGQLARWGFTMIDTQFHTDHLASLGAYEISRARYLERLADALQEPTRTGPWAFDDAAHEPRGL